MRQNDEFEWNCTCRKKAWHSAICFTLVRWFSKRPSFFYTSFSSRCNILVSFYFLFIHVNRPGRIVKNRANGNVALLVSLSTLKVLLFIVFSYQQSVLNRCNFSEYLSFMSLPFILFSLLIQFLLLFPENYIRYQKLPCPKFYKHNKNFFCICVNYIIKSGLFLLSAAKFNRTLKRWFSQRNKIIWNYWLIYYNYLLFNMIKKSIALFRSFFENNYA